jgi:hypothetical protein
MGIEDQKKLTDGKGGWDFVKDYAKSKKEQITTKVENIIGGIKATPAAIKKTFKKDED